MDGLLTVFRRNRFGCSGVCAMWRRVMAVLVRLSSLMVAELRLAVAISRSA